MITPAEVWEKVKADPLAAFSHMCTGALIVILVQQC